MEDDTITTVSKRLSKALGLIESCDVNELEWYFEKHPDYNDEVRYRLRDAARFLGYALATFTTWDEDLDSADPLPVKATEGKKEEKKFNLYWTPPHDKYVEIFLGYYRTIEGAAAAACAVSGDADEDEYNDILTAWGKDSAYTDSNSGIFRLEKDFGEKDA